MIPLGQFGGEGVGLHIGVFDTILFIDSDKNGNIEPMVIPISFGINEIEQCLNKVSSILSENGFQHLPIYLCVSGIQVHYFLSRVPKLSANHLSKAFRLQMKQELGEDAASLYSLPLWTHKSEDGEQQEYLVAGVKREFRDHIIQHFKKLDLKMGGWDVDILSYYRVSDYLWRRIQCDESSRFIIRLEKDHCHLITISPQGQLLSTHLAVGTGLFIEQMEKINKGELKSNSELQNQCRPFIHQIKTQLYAMCNEFGVPLPTHFILLGAATLLDGFIDCIAREINITPIAFDNLFPTEAIVAVGGMIQRKSSFRVNFFPSRKKLLWKSIGSGLKRMRFRSLVGPGFNPLERIRSFGNFAKIGFVAIPLLAVASFPFIDRMRAEKWIKSEKQEFEKVATYKSIIEKAEQREIDYDRRTALIKLIREKKYNISSAIKELISIVPTNMKIQALQLKNGALTIKGIAKSHTQVQEYLKQAENFRFLSEPLPIAMVESKEGASFEISFKVRL